MRVDILLTCGEHLLDRINSLRGKVWFHKSRLTPPLSINVPVPNPESQSLCTLCIFV